MGCEGGINAVKASEVRDRWPEVRDALRAEIARPGSYCSRDIEVPEECGDTDEEVVAALRKVFRSCDTPCLLGEWIILASGDNVSDEADILGDVVLYAVGGRYIETWT